MPSSKTVTVTPGYVDPAAVQRASDGDSKWFKDRWGVSYRCRPAIRGELPDVVWHANKVRLVLVHQIASGARVRYPLNAETVDPMLLPQAALERIHKAGQENANV